MSKTREVDVPSILNEWNPDMPWRIVKDRDGSLVFMHDTQGRLITDLEVLRTCLHGMTNWSGLEERIMEAGPVNIKRLLEALYVLTTHVIENSKEEDS